MDYAQVRAEVRGAAVINPLGMLTLKYKLILGGVGLLVLLWAGRQWLNKHDSKIERETRIKVAGEINKSKEAEWKAKEDAIVKAAATVDAERSVITAASEQLRQDRANLSRTLSDAQAAIQRERNRQYANAANIGAADLDAAIRAISAELAAAQ
jgi:hypothetical protein